MPQRSSDWKACCRHMPRDSYRKFVPVPRTVNLQSCRRSDSVEPHGYQRKVLWNSPPRRSRRRDLDQPQAASGSLEFAAALKAAVTWSPKQHLLDSGSEDQDVVVEVTNDRHTHLRFGDDDLGRRPVAGTSFYATYRTGNGSIGNVGRTEFAIWHFETLNLPVSTAFAIRSRRQAEKIPSLWITLAFMHLHNTKNFDEPSLLTTMRPSPCENSRMRSSRLERCSIGWGPGTKCPSRSIRSRPRQTQWHL